MKPKIFQRLVLLTLLSLFAIATGNTSHASPSQATTPPDIGATVGTCQPNWRINSLQISPDGNFLLGTWDEGTARMWDLKTGAVIRTFSLASPAPISEARFSPDGKYVLASVDFAPNLVDRMAALWEANTAQQMRTFNVDKTPKLIAYIIGPLA